MANVIRDRNINLQIARQPHHLSSIIDSPINEYKKQDETLSTIPMSRFKRSRSRNNSEEEQVSNRRFKRSRNISPKPNNYLRSPYLITDSQVSNGTNLANSQPSEIHRQSNLLVFQSLKPTQNIEKNSDSPNIAQMRYRRPLTPHKTERQLQAGYQNTSTADKNPAEDQWLKQLDAKDIELAELQNLVEKLQAERDNLKKLALVSQKEKIKTLNEKNRLESRNTIIQKQLQTKSMKLLQLENSLIVNEQDLVQTRNSLEKLRSVIKQNRMVQLQAECKRLDLENTELKRNSLSIKQESDSIKLQRGKLLLTVETLNMKMSKLQASIMPKQKSFQIESMRQNYLNKQINSLRIELQQKRSTRQVDLQAIIDSLQKQLTNKQSLLANLNIKLDCMKRKEVEFKEQLKKQTANEYNQLRDRFRKLLLDHQKVRKAHNQLKIECAALNRNKSHVQVKKVVTPEKNAASLNRSSSELSLSLSSGEDP